MNIRRIYIGGWFQRTTLHLTEIWIFLKDQKSHLDFSTKDLAKAHANLKIRDVTRESGPLEYIQVHTRLGIQYRIYEDGLIVLEKPFTSLKQDFAAINQYYDQALSKSLSLLFSKGAPVPKELANITTIYPYIVTVEDGTKDAINRLFKQCDERVYSVLSSKNVEVYRSSGVIVINNLRDEDLAREVIESEIFFREFKTQLQRYLSIHRTIWEKIEHIKERGQIRGTDVDPLKNQLTGYQKTLTLISARINQMDAYLRTRQKITDSKNIDDDLRPLFQFKFETLEDTHRYIRHLWTMTQQYLDSALETFTALQNKSTKSTISSLQLITTIGVVAGVLGYLGKDSLPKITSMGMVYFALLLGVTWILNTVVSRFYKSRKYTIMVQNAKDI